MRNAVHNNYVVTYVICHRMMRNSFSRGLRCPRRNAKKENGRIRLRGNYEQGRTILASLPTFLACLVPRSSDPCLGMTKRFRCSANSPKAEPTVGYELKRKEAKGGTKLSSAITN